MRTAVTNTEATKQEQIDMRREKVKKCIRLGMTYQMAADALKVHKNTIVSDMKAIKDEDRSKVVNAEAYTEIGAHIAKLDESERLAMMDYHACQPGDAKRNSFLRTAMQATAEKIQLQQQAGMIPKVADNLNITGMMEVMKLPDDALERRLQELKQTLLTSDDFEGDYANRMLASDN